MEWYRILSVSVIYLLLLVRPYAAAQEILTVTDPKVHVYTGSDATQPVLAELTRGTVLPILETRQGWYKILLDDGREGWVPRTSGPEANKTINTAHSDIRRVALVIGNAAYGGNLSLRNPVNDAVDMATRLQQLGFQVTQLLDADQRTMEEAIREFGRALARDEQGMGLFYYAGHGIQVKGVNYLVPLGAQLVEETDARYEAVDVGRVLDAMDRARNRLNVVILDACRNNPFARSWTRSAGRTQGLAQMQAARGMLIAYATSPGHVAEDGQGRNGIYTQHLLEQMMVPGQPVEQTFKHVRQGVAATTEGKQIPWESSSLIGDFYFNPAGIAPLATGQLVAEGGGTPPAGTDTTVYAPGRQPVDPQTAARVWAMVKDSNRPEDIQQVIPMLRGTQYESVAHLRLSMLDRPVRVQLRSQTPGVIYDHPNPLNVQRGDPVNLTVTATAPGFQSKTLTLRSPGLDRDTVLDFGALVPGLIPIYFQSETPGVIYDQPNPLRLPYGKHIDMQVTARAEGYRSKTMPLKVASLVEGKMLNFGALEKSEVRIGHFIKYDNGTVLDTRTNLMWMTGDHYNIEGTYVRSWQDAKRWAFKMNQQRYAGYINWRVPKTEEYDTIYDDRRPIKSYRGKPLGYSEAFDNGGGEVYWSSQDLGAGRGYAWMVNFRSGGTRTFPKDRPKKTVSVRLVRDVVR